LVLVGGLILAVAGGVEVSSEVRQPVVRAVVAAPLSSSGTTIDLSGWKLSIPVKNSKGTPTLLQPATPVAPWMVPDPTGALVFWAPSSGAVTTENSSHPRTELDSLTHFTGGSSGQVHTLHATVAVHQEPADGEGIILGQIHGADDISSVSFVMLRYQRGRVVVAVKQVQKGSSTTYYPLANGVPLNTPFDFGISDMGNGKLVFSITRHGRIVRVGAPVPAVFKGATMRFQAGSYQQAEKPAGPLDGGKVTFRKLAEMPVTASPGAPVPAAAPAAAPPAVPAPVAPAQATPFDAPAPISATS
jgi:hypothetical protein